MPKLKDSTRQLRRAQIAAAALRCFARSGFAETSMADIIAESGMSAGSIYSHFASKADLIRFVSCDVLTARSDEILRRAGPSGLVTPGAIVEVLTESLMSDPDGAQILLQIWSAAPRDPELAAIVRERLAAVRDTLADVLGPWAQSTAQGDAPPATASLRAADVVLTAVQGIIVRRALDPAADLRAVRQAAAETIGLLDTAPMAHGRAARRGRASPRSANSGSSAVG